MTRPELATEQASARPAIRLRVLGAVDLCDEQGNPVRPILAQPRRFALLAYLAMSSRRGFVRRDRTIALFWPEHDSEHARAALNRAVYFLRQSIGDRVIVSRGSDEIAVSADHLWCDAVALQTAVGEGRYADAVALCRGELLEGFFVSNAPGFERWVDEERRRLASDISRAAWSLADDAERDANYTAAAQWCSWAVDRSHLDEAGVRRLMTVLDRAGDRAGAVLAYDRFARRLGADLELSPSPETQRLLDAIRQRDTTGQTPRVAFDGKGDAGPIDVANVAGSPAELAAALPSHPSAKVRRRTFIGLGVLGAIAVAAVLAMRATLHSTPVDPRRVAVWSTWTSPGDRAPDFVVERTDAAIRDGLVQTGLVAVILSPASPDARSVEPLDVRRVARETGAGMLVVTSLHRTGDSLRLTARILETLGGQVRWLVPATTLPVSAPDASVDTVAERVAGAFAALVDPRYASWMPVATSPPTFRAFEEFDRATDLKLHNRPSDALPHFERAAHVLPNRFLYGLAENARWLNRPRRSIELLERLGPDGSMGFGYWYLMADSYHQLGEHQRELDVAVHGRRRHPARPTAVIVEARARAALGDVAGALALVDTMLALPRDGRDTPGTMMLQTAEELQAHGHVAEGARLLNRAIAWFGARPPGEAASLIMRRQLARAVYDAGRWPVADSLFRELARDDRDGVADHRAMLGAIAAHRGDTTEARRWVATLRELSRSVNRPREDATFGQARIMAVLGDAPESLRLLREALGGQGMDLHTDVDFARLAGDPGYQLFVRPKG
jgi:DNA-binding SARP family transcriptional activator/tetratricopeptide (TPR) repeat protein